MELGERKKLILKALIDDYIATAEPISSLSIVQNHDFGLSSATVRNELADLEILGYIDKPHTSAGRIPSEKGYRFYVNSLMEEYDMSELDDESVQFEMSLKMQRLEKLLEEASEVISEIMHYTTFVAIKRANEESDVYISGASNILNQPEFSDIERARKFLNFIDRRENMKRMVGALNDADKIDIKIGSESGEEAMQKTSMVVATCDVSPQIRTKVGIIGPTRMNYKKVVSSLMHINDRMGQILFNIFYDE